MQRAWQECWWWNHNKYHNLFDSLSEMAFLHNIRIKIDVIISETENIYSYKYIENVTELLLYIICISNNNSDHFYHYYFYINKSITDVKKRKKKENT